MKGEDVFESGDGEVFLEKGRHGGIIDGEDCYGLAAVDFVGEVSDGEVVVEGGESRVFAENAGDVVAAGGGGTGGGGVNK